MSTPRTFPDLLDVRLRSDPGQPLVTAYDDRTGERAELSVTTYANWVSKTANLLLDDLDLEPGDTVLLDMPEHWLVPVFLGAAWSAGLAVTTEASVSHELVVCGPEGLAEHAERLGADRVLGCSLRPFAVRFAVPLPPGVVDFGLAWPGQSDVFLAPEPVTPDAVAWRASEQEWSQADLLDRARASSHAQGVRLLSDEHPALDQGVPVTLAPLAHGGSMVLVAGADAGAHADAHPDVWAARRDSERATAELRRAQPPSE